MKTLNEVTTGARLLEWRQQAGLSRRQLSDLTHYSVSRIAHLETEPLTVLSSRMQKAITQIDGQMHCFKKTAMILRKLEEYNQDKSGFFAQDFARVDDSLYDMLSVDPDDCSHFSETLQYIGELADKIQQIADIKPGRD